MSAPEKFVAGISVPIHDVKTKKLRLIPDERGWLMEGDARGGCRTLPIIYGVRRAAWMISPSFVVPFVMISIGAWTGVLTGHFILLQLLSLVMTAYGIYVCYLMLRRPEDLAVEENHVSWAHMYRMMFVAQIGFALAYLF